MALCYIDASAMVKHYIPKLEGIWLRQLCDGLSPRSMHAQHLILAAEMTHEEVVGGASGP
jgi:hypothetical protein